MVEDSPDTFVARWKHLATDAILHARVEGSPLLEIDAGGAILQVLERTNPYLANPGNARVIINPTIRLREPDSDEPSLRVPHLGQVSGTATVQSHEGPIVVLDAGVPIVAALDPTATHDENLLQQGAFISFDASAPIHGFVVAPEHRRITEARAVDEAH